MLQAWNVSLGALCFAALAVCCIILAGRVYYSYKQRKHWYAQALPFRQLQHSHFSSIVAQCNIVAVWWCHFHDYMQVQTQEGYSCAKWHRAWCSGTAARSVH